MTDETKPLVESLFRYVSCRMSADFIFSVAMIAYLAIACIVYGYFVAAFIDSMNGAAVILGAVVAAVWPVSAHLYLGASLA